jgi:histidine triad (HIT) family protein
MPADRAIAVRFCYSDRMEACGFCRIATGEAPAQIVWESEGVLGIKPLEEVSKGHALLIPKAHFRDLFDIDEATLAEIASAARQVARRLVEEHGATGVNLLHASGADAQQSAFRFHLHVVPRYPGDGLDLWIQQGL